MKLITQCVFKLSHGATQAKKLKKLGILNRSKGSRSSSSNLMTTVMLLIAVDAIVMNKVKMIKWAQYRHVKLSLPLTDIRRTALQ